MTFSPSTSPSPGYGPLVAVEAVLFFIGVEAWEWAKRVFFRRRARNHPMPTLVEGVPEQA